MPRVPCVCAPDASARAVWPSRSPPDLSPRLVPSRGSTPRQGVIGATPSPSTTGLPTICQPQFVTFLPHLHDRLTTNPAGIIARAMTPHGHQDTQQTVPNIAQGLAMPLS